MPVPDEEEQQEVARPQRLPRVEPEPDQRDRADHAGQRFVEEERVEERRFRVGAAARVGGDAMRAVDRDAPRQLRRRAVQLLVEEVPPARDGLHHEQPRRHDVGPAQERDTLVAGVQECGDGPRDDPAIHAEPGVRRQEDLDQVVLVERPLVDDVIGAAADERRDRDDDDPVGQDLGVLAGPPREPDHDQVGRGETQRVADPVPVDRDRAELDRDRVRGEVEHPRKCSGVLPILPAVNAEFNVWLLIVGLVVGAGLVWLVVMDSRRRESEIDAVELPREAAWLSAVMTEDGDDGQPGDGRTAAAPPSRLPRRAATGRAGGIGRGRPAIARRRRGGDPERPGRAVRAPRAGPGRCRQRSPQRRPVRRRRSRRSTGR